MTLSFDVAPGYSLGRGGEGHPRGRRGRSGCRPACTPSFQGTAQAFRDSRSRTSRSSILAALITVYIVLGVLYESYIHPVTILSTLPSAGVGALLALMLCGTEFDIIALIGIVLLIGIVKKNAIMMIDFALEAEREREALAARVDQQGLPAALPADHDDHASPRCSAACRWRSGAGTGSELRRPLGITIVGGLLISQVLTLYTTPVIYLYMERLGGWLPRAAPAKAHPAGAR